jgi:hypothetical protein
VASVDFRIDSTLPCAIGIIRLSKIFELKFLLHLNDVTDLLANPKLEDLFYREASMVKQPLSGVCGFGLG